MVSRQRGFTLVELVVSISLIAIALMGVAYSLQFSVRYSADPLWQSKAISLATSYSEEILRQPYDALSRTSTLGVCNPCTPENRFGPEQESRANGINQFNDVDDYHGLNEKTHNVLGEPRENYRNYQVAIRVAYAGKELGLDQQQSAKRIELKITPPGQKPLYYVFYRGNH